MRCCAHLHAGSDLVRGGATSFAPSSPPCVFEPPSSFLFSTPRKTWFPLCSTATKTDTSARQGGRGLCVLGGGVLKRRLQRVPGGAYWEYNLMRLFASLETTFTGAKQHTHRPPPLLLSTNIPYPTKRHTFPPPRPVLPVFTLFFAAVSHVLKVVCVIGWKHLACECDIAVPFSHKLIKWILTETIAPVWICDI